MGIQFALTGWVGFTGDVGCADLMVFWMMYLQKELAASFAPYLRRRVQDDLWLPLVGLDLACNAARLARKVRQDRKGASVLGRYPAGEGLARIRAAHIEKSVSSA
jgi:hypothetical protein